MSTREELQQAIAASRPVPPANLEALTIRGVYDPERLVGKELLSSIPIQDWIESAQAGDEILLSSRFVAPRINPLALRAADDAGAARDLRLLRYLSFLITMWQTSSSHGTKPRRLARRAHLNRSLAPAPDAVVHALVKTFSDGGSMNDFYQDKVLTHAAVYALLLGDCEVDVWQLQQDMRVDEQMMTRSFRAVGARVKKQAVQGRTVLKAQLRLPLEFPKMGRGFSRSKK